MTHQTALVSLALALTMVAGGVARAQAESPAADAPAADGKTGITHSKAPIDITADTAEVNNSRCIFVWRGAAEAVQEKSHLRADTITVYSHPKASSSSGRGGGGGNLDGQGACGGTDRIEADGHVYYMNPDQNARGDHAVYAEDKDQIVLTGDVVVVQGQNVARGSRLTIKISTHEATMESAVTGAGRPGRVRAVYYPDKSKTASDGDKAPSPSGPARP